MQSKKRKSHSKTNVRPNRSASAKSTPEKPIFQQWWFWLVIAAVVGCLCLILLKDSIAKAGTNTTGSTENTIKDTYITCDLGDTFDANGMHITYVGVEKWLPEGETSHPQPGYTFIRLKIAAENKSTEIREIYDNEFSCFADGGIQVMEFFKDENLKGGILAPGQQDEGYIYYSVPEEANTIEVVYTSYLTWRHNFAILPIDISE